MPSMLGISNDCFRLLGADYSPALSGATKPERAVLDAWDTLRDAEMEAHPWTFLRTRINLAASATVPAFGYGAAYPLPSNCLQVLDCPGLDFRDWTIETIGDIDAGTAVKAILTWSAGSIGVPNPGALAVQYVARITEPGSWPATFAKAIAARLAYELCEQITQSTSKKEFAGQQYLQAIRVARQTNAIEQPPTEEPMDDFVAVRL
jgi:hypothetical protein